MEEERSGVSMVFLPKLQNLNLIVVKVFIVLTPQFLSHDKDQLTKELQQHVKSVTVSCKSPRKVINFLPEHFHPGPDFSGIPWMLIIIVASLGISTLAIFFWKTSLSFSCVKYIHIIVQLVSQMSFLKSVLKSRNINDRSTDLQGKAWKSNSGTQEKIKMDLKDFSTSWRSTEAKVQAEIQKVAMKVNSHRKISGQRKTAEEEKLRMKERERAEKERRLSEVEETMKLALEKIPICRSGHGCIFLPTVLCSSLAEGDSREEGCLQAAQMGNDGKAGSAGETHESGGRPGMAGAREPFLERFRTSFGSHKEQPLCPT
ncbi:nuclear pore complex-interacting protein family member A2-like [Hylobates moloch]|uniref:nuclear pore complex-interacting protein family member A2-like n=1 Tax=Hylobates moloch TaxID=81572 RepID=UPI002675A28E|nr:nuclear pore complex-interacting protein family member A2-like [Hylobates moloch]